MKTHLPRRRDPVCAAIVAAVAVWVLSLGADGAAGAGVVKTGDSVVDARALTIQGDFGQCINGLSFQQDALASCAGHQYAGYYDAARRVCLARRKLPAGAWDILRFEDWKFGGNDAHNIISIGLCPADGTLHLAFDHHGSPLHYRASRPGTITRPEETKWTADLFGPVTSEIEPGKPLRGVTYPRFWSTPEGGLQFCFRSGGSGSGDRLLADYDPARATWRNLRQIDSRKGTFTDRFDTSPSRCSYPNGYTVDARGRLHTTWVWRERTQGANHDLMYAWSDDRGVTWHNNQGERVGDTRVPDRVIRLDSPGIVVVPIDRSRCLMNTHTQAVDSRGRIHVVMWHATEQSLSAARTKSTSCWGPPDARRYHHYRREPDGAWRHVELPGVAGNRPKLFLDRNDNAWLIFNRWHPDQAHPDERGVVRGKGDLAIMNATAGAQWSDWHIAHVEPGPFLNEMLGDPTRWQTEAVLSVLVQQSPAHPHDPTPLRILDFTLTPTPAPTVAPAAQAFSGTFDPYAFRDKTAADAVVFRPNPACGECHASGRISRDAHGVPSLHLEVEHGKQACSWTIVGKQGPEGILFENPKLRILCAGDELRGEYTGRMKARVRLDTVERKHTPDPGADPAPRSNGDSRAAINRADPGRP